MQTTSQASKKYLNTSGIQSVIQRFIYKTVDFGTLNDCI